MKHQPISNYGDDQDEVMFQHHVAMAQRQAAIVGKPGLRLSDKLTWRKWSKMRTAKLWQAVALHCQLDPHYMQMASIRFDEDLPAESFARLYQERISIAIQHMRDGVLQSLSPPEESSLSKEVRLCDYAQWAQGLDMPLPPEFPTEPTSRELANTQQWPWGSHTTKWLKLLKEAGEFWRPVSEGGNYDPTDPDTAITNEAMTYWLEKKKVKGKLVSHNVAAVMATILRADNVASGRRKRKG